VRHEDAGDVDGVPHLGGVGRLDGVLAAKGVGNVVVAFSRTGEHRLIEVLRATTSQGVDVYVVPRFFDIAIAGVEASDLWGLPLQRLRQPGPLVRGWRLKRLFDLVVASALLLVASPVLAALAIAVKVSSPGPVLFRQRRLGLNARPFDLLKFRSLPVNGDSDTTWSVTTDPRIGRVGRFLRASSLDELPQLWNVLRGEMSLIGPRPERPHFAARFDAEIPHYPARLRVPPGLTGHAQVHGLRGDTSIEDRARFDNRYIERWSVWHDLAILLRTGGVVLRGHGDRR
jgi:exopolysaccharide biosynthesis polyprenyl glycosylphosphotransferase